jgi:multicomponent Na+:H+ antiporter subunit F
MSEWYQFLSVVILMTVIGGLPRVYWGPTRADAMLAAQLCGTSSVGILLLLAAAQDNPVLYDVALVFSLLAAVATVSFIRLAWHQPMSDGEE